MIRTTTLLWAFLALVMGCALFLLKHEVQTLEDQLASINRTTRRDRQAIHVLEAEWAYLNDPQRLSTLADKLLGMRPIPPEAIVATVALPMRTAPRNVAQEDAPSASVAELTSGSPLPLRKPTSQLVSDHGAAAIKQSIVDRRR